MAFNYSYNKQAVPDLLLTYIISNTSVVPLNLAYNLATFDIVVSYSVALTIGEEGDLNNAISNYTYVDTNNNANFNTVLLADLSVTGNVVSNTLSATSIYGDGAFITNLIWVSGSTGVSSIKANNGTPIDATGNYSVAEGNGTLASGISSHAEGNLSKALGNYSHAEGNQTTATTESSHTEGQYTVATGISAHAEGNGTTASGDASHAEGTATIASGEYSHAEGFSTKAIGDRSHAEGQLTTASGLTSHAEGYKTTAIGDYNHAGGFQSVASGNTSFVHGQNSSALGTTTIVFGNNLTGTSNNTLYSNNIVVTTQTTSPIISGTSYSGYSVTLSEMVSAATPSTGATVYLSSIGNRKLLGHKSSLGTTINYQPAMFNSKLGFWNPSGNVATAPGIFGIGTLTAQGTATARNVATTNIFTRTKRIAVVSANPAGSTCGYRSGVAQYTVGTGTSGIGGFYYVVRFGCGDALTACRQFVGLRSSTAPPTDVEPSTLTNCIGVGHGIANTNLLIYYGGSAAQTPINLGASFPNNTNSTDLYELVLYAPSTTNNQVWYQVTRLNTGVVASGRLTGTAGTALPASTTLLTNNDYRGNGGLAGIVTLEFISIYIETEN